MHLSVARKMIIERGVATKEKWEEALQSALNETDFAPVQNGKSSAGVVAGK